MHIAPARRRPPSFTRSIYLLALLPLLLLCSCGGQKEAQVLRLAHTLNTTHPVHKGMERMAEALDSISQGKMKLEIYSSGQLGSESQCLELLQIGSLAMTKVSAAVMDRFAPSYSVLGLPYLFKDRETSFRVFDGPIGQEILADGAEFRLRGLTFFDAGTRSFYTKDGPVRTPADVVGKKVRVMNSPMSVQLIKTLGGSPTPISFGELYTALQQGVVDAAENNLPSYYSSRHYEVTPFYSYDRHSAVPDVLIIGTATWDKLSEERQGWLRQATRIATVYQRGLWQAAEEEAVAAMREAGVTFTEVDGSSFRAAVQPMFEAARNNPVQARLLERIQAVE